jgi:hypothetical protein
VRSSAWTWLFSSTQDQGVVWGMEVRAHDVAHFFHEERVGGEFEALGAMRLEPEELEVAADRTLGNPGFFSDQAHTPVGGALGFGVQDAINQCRHLLIAMSARASGPGSVLIWTDFKLGHYQSGGGLCSGFAGRGVGIGTG